MSQILINHNIPQYHMIIHFDQWNLLGSKFIRIRICRLEF
jgi:hypothetical protein